MAEEEQKILKEYSSPGLRKNEMSRSAKKLHLASIGIRGEYADKILNELYGGKNDAKA